MKLLFNLIATVAWIAGIVIANGFWSVFFAIFVPLWAWYLLVEALLIHYGII